MSIKQNFAGFEFSCQCFRIVRKQTVPRFFGCFSKEQPLAVFWLWGRSSGLVVANTSNTFHYEPVQTGLPASAVVSFY
jgi:hypothetical protein